MVDRSNLYADCKDLTLDLVRFASDAAFAIDADSNIVAWNDRARRLLGYTSAEVTGRFCGEVLQATLPGGEPLCHHNCDVFRCLLDCRPYGINDCRMRLVDGQWLSASISSVAMSERTRRLTAGKVMAVVFLRKTAAENSVPEHSTLQVYTLGGFGISLAGHSIDTGTWKRKQAVTLLKYLVTQLGRPVHRECLIDCLWPDINEASGWERLKVTMYCLRREIRAFGMSDEVIKTVDKAYLLRKDAIWLDVDAFERRIAEGKALQKQARWREALDKYAAARNLYRGDYLEEEPFSDWCAEERERLREVYLDLLSRTAECHAELGENVEAEQICRKALVFDPCRENFHYALMQYAVNSGRPDLALSQYRNCKRMLEREFGVGPMPETKRFYHQIISNTGCGEKIPAREYSS